MTDTFTKKVKNNSIKKESWFRNSDESFCISILQIPTKARMCGVNSPMGKRLLDPAPVIQLHFNPKYSPSEPTNSVSATSFPNLHHHKDEKQQSKHHHQFANKYVCVSSLCPPENNNSIGLCKSTKERITKYAQLLVGTTCKTPVQLSITSANTPKPIFVFHDLSIRLNGKFRLKFTCICLTTYVFDD